MANVLFDPDPKLCFQLNVQLKRHSDICEGNSWQSEASAENSISRLSGWPHQATSGVLYKITTKEWKRIHEGDTDRCDTNACLPLGLVCLPPTRSSNFCIPLTAKFKWLISFTLPFVDNRQPLQNAMNTLLMCHI